MALDASGIAMGSVLSFAGVGGLALGLATKDVVSNLVGGCLVFLTDPFREGDKISFASGPISKVSTIGWYNTVMIGIDDQVRTIPNAQFVSNVISNRTRMTHRELRQSVYLTHASLPKIDSIVEGIRDELGAINGLDRSKPFWVCLKSIGETSVEVEINAHFKGNNSELFNGKRQQALIAISKVVRNMGAEFAVLSYIPPVSTSTRN